MKITRSQLRRLIEATIPPKNPLDYIDDPEEKNNIQSFININDKKKRYVNQGYELAKNLQTPKKMVQGDLEWEDLGYEGDDYPADLKNYKIAEISNRLMSIIGSERNFKILGSFFKSQNAYFAQGQSNWVEEVCDELYKCVNSPITVLFKLGPAHYLPGGSDKEIIEFVKKIDNMSQEEMSQLRVDTGEIALFDIPPIDGVVLDVLLEGLDYLDIVDSGHDMNSYSANYTRKGIALPRKRQQELYDTIRGAASIVEYDSVINIKY